MMSGFGTMEMGGGSNDIGRLFGTITPVVAPELMLTAIFYGILVSVVFDYILLGGHPSSIS
jgi:hypothetical protein